MPLDRAISIHALREEGDSSGTLRCGFATGFLSTPSARRATPARRCRLPCPCISIHALREEGDVYCRRGESHHRNFYPRPPRGGRQGNTAALSVTTIFLSTPSARRATRRAAYSEHRLDDFYPRPPRGGRLARLFKLTMDNCISIHALREEGDL